MYMNSLQRVTTIVLVLLILLITQVFGQSKSVAEVKALTETIYPALEKLYQNLHEYPELALQEKQTSKKISGELNKLGFEVIENIGGYGLAAILKNGAGPTVLIRTDMDGLPLEEKTGLPFSSKAKGINAAGAEVNVMHACGHDLHMTVFVGTAKILSQLKKRWKGTLVLVAQPAEEVGFGAAMMFDDGLYKKIPYPDYALALHNNASLAAGTVGYNTKNFMASVDMMNITVKGKGGHGASPHQTVDPIVLSAQMILAFQTIVSREINPLEPAVITVGSIHGGTVHNIIPDEVKLQLTLRSYSSEVRAQIITAIKNKSKYLALQAGLSEDRFPEITINDPKTPATINDEALTQKIKSVFETTFGPANVINVPPSMVGEDFSRFALQEKKVPICMFWLGVVNPENLKTSQQSGVPLPSLHSSTFAPQVDKSIRTGVIAMSEAALLLLQ
jgi:hippurate hydrolase